MDASPPSAAGDNEAMRKSSRPERRHCLHQSRKILARLGSADEEYVRPRYRRFCRWLRKENGIHAVPYDADAVRRHAEVRREVVSSIVRRDNDDVGSLEHAGSRSASVKPAPRRHRIREQHRYEIMHRHDEWRPAPSERCARRGTVIHICASSSCGPAACEGIPVEVLPRGRQPLAECASLEHWSAAQHDRTYIRTIRQCFHQRPGSSRRPRRRLPRMLGVDRYCDQATGSSSPRRSGNV